MNNIAVSVGTRQQKKSNNFSISKIQIEILSLFIDRQRGLNSFRIYQQCVARILKIGHRSAHRHINELYRMGLLRKIRHKQGKYDDACEYSVPASVVHRLRRLRKTFKSPMFAMAISTLMSFFNIAVNAVQNVFKTFGVAIKYNRFIFPVYTLRRERYIPEPTYIPKDRVIFKTYFRKRNSMTPFVPCPELQELTKMLNLTKWGQIRMSPFAGIMISQAMKSFKKLSVAPKDPFSWIFMACKTLSETSGISIDWDRFYALKEQFNMPDNAEMILPRVVKPSVNPEVYREKTPEQEEKMRALKERVANDPKLLAMQQGFAAMAPR